MELGSTTEGKTLPRWGLRAHGSRSVSAQVLADQSDGEHCAPTPVRIRQRGYNPGLVGVSLGEHKLGQDHVPLLLPHHMLKLLRTVRLAPSQEGADFRRQEGRAIGW